MVLPDYVRSIVAEWSPSIFTLAGDARGDASRDTAFQVYVWSAEHGLVVRETRPRTDTSAADDDAEPFLAYETPPRRITTRTAAA